MTKRRSATIATDPRSVCTSWKAPCWWRPLYNAKNQPTQPWKRTARTAKIPRSSQSILSAAKSNRNSTAKVKAMTQASASTENCRTREASRTAPSGSARAGAFGLLDCMFPHCEVIAASFAACRINFLTAARTSRSCAQQRCGFSLSQHRRV